MNTEGDNLTANKANDSSTLTTLLTEITTRCDKQTEEISKWLVYTKEFKKSIVDALERSDPVATVQAPRSPKMPVGTYK